MMKHTFSTLLMALMMGLMLPCTAWGQFYDAVVAQDGSGDYRTIQDAILSIRDYKPEGRQRILVRKGVYEEKVVVPTYKTNISLIGEDRDSTILVWHDHANLRNTGHFEGVVLGSNADAHGNDGRNASSDRGHRMGTFESYTLLVLGEGFECENMTIVNDAMTHHNPNWRKDHSNAAGVGQAVTLHTEADRAVYRNCRLLGFQDTVFTGNGRSRQIFYRCWIEGTVDFIFGPATVWFEQCRLHALTDGYLTAASTPAENPYGYVFNRCRVTAEPTVTRTFLGRPWRNWASVIFKDCELPAQIPAGGWNNWGDPARELTARYAEYNSKGDGANAAQRVAWSRQLTHPEAQRITPERVMQQGPRQWKSNVWPVTFRDVHFAFYDENLDVGTRYAEKTLEPAQVPADPEKYVEPLVLKLDSVDCVTLVEYLSAAMLGRCASPEPNDSIFQRFVQALRYRGGVRGNYATRKHYFSEWISDAERMGMMTDISGKATGAKVLKKKINFMSQNANLYPQLAKSPALLNEIKKTEEQLSAASVYYIPTSQIAKNYEMMRHGDIVAFVSGTSGLDIQHVGFVWWQDTDNLKPQLMHASSSLHRVCLDVLELEQYARSLTRCEGIRIIRLNAR